MIISEARNQREWDDFLRAQRFCPFLQSWTMGEVYRAIGQAPIRLELREDGNIRGICFGYVVTAKRGRHLAVPYGPVFAGQWTADSGQWTTLLEELSRIARAEKCSFIRISPFIPKHEWTHAQKGITPSPLHLLAEHLWYIPLQHPDVWEETCVRFFAEASAKAGAVEPPSTGPNEDDLMKNMRSTTRNLIRRAQKEGVEVMASTDPVEDLERYFLPLHEETRKRHHFTPYTDAFFRAQVKYFAECDACTLYTARHKSDVLATSIHMHFGDETSYHHGASKHSPIPASTLLQWTAITDALKRGDRIYNFWGIAPIGTMELGKWKVENERHPFAGVTMFKTGFGGKLLELVHCTDLPLSPTYRFTRAFEKIRKWKRGF